MTKKRKSNLITYKQDILAIYNRLVKACLRADNEWPLKPGMSFDRYLVEEPSTGELMFFTRTKRWGDKLNKIYSIFAYEGYGCTILYPKDFDKPVSDFVPDSYQFWSEGFAGSYFLLACRNLGKVRMKRPNKRQLEIQVKNGKK